MGPRRARAQKSYSQRGATRDRLPRTAEGIRYSTSSLELGRVVRPLRAPAASNQHARTHNRNAESVWLTKR